MKSVTEPRFGIKNILAAMGLTVCVMLMSAPAHAQDEPPTADEIAEARGQAALADGRAAMSAGRWREAVDRFQEALTHLPGNPEAMAGLREAEARLNEGTTSQSVAQERERLRQRTIVEFEEGFRRASDLLARADFDAASQEILTATLLLQQRRDYLTRAEYEQFNARADRLAAQINEARRLAEVAAARDAAAEAREQQELLREQELRERQRIIDENLRRVRQLQAELKYHEALQVVDEILFIDPYNPSALVLRDVLRTSMMYRIYNDIHRRKDYAIGVLSLEAQESVIPPSPNITGPGPRSTSGLMQYPEDWPVLSFRRLGGGGYQETEADRHVRTQLAQARVPIDFSNNSFEQVMSYLKHVTGLNVYVDYKALSNVGIDPDSTINLQLRDVSAATALERIFDQVGTGQDRPQFTIQDGVLIVSSDQALRRRTSLIVYDIRDLLFQVPTFDNAPQLDLETAINQGSQDRVQAGGGGTSGGGGGGGNGGRSGGSIFTGAQGDPSRPSREELVRQIVDIIQTTIDTDGWKDLGGDTGSLQELNGNLIITNTPNNHRAIDHLLGQLREIRALQINVESRFLTVSTDWFERIGIDLDLYFNTNNDMFRAARAADPNFHLSDFFNDDGTLRDPLVFGSPAQVLDPDHPANTVPTGSYIGVPGTAPPDQFQNVTYPLIGIPGQPIRNTGGFAPIGVQQNSNSLIDSVANFASTFALAANATPALTVGIQFLDDIQVDLLIEATQADRRSVTMTAPRLTFFNGQRSWVAVLTQRAFVSSLTPVTGDASGAFQPEIGIVTDGFRLDVEGVISADRRYVTMTVIFDFSELLAIETQEFQGAAGGGGIGGGGSSVFSGSISLPTVGVSQIRTTVSVPDRGTVMLGGQRRVREVEVETGVPVLSKIPFINRFFTNRATSKDELTLLILIRPEIIIQQENEDILFPGLGDALGGAGSYIR